MAAARAAECDLFLCWRLNRHMTAHSASCRSIEALSQACRMLRGARNTKCEGHAARSLPAGGRGLGLDALVAIAYPLRELKLASPLGAIKAGGAAAVKHNRPPP